MKHLSILYVTFPNPEEASKVAKSLIEKKLIACANIFPSMTSVYLWKGVPHEDKESAAIFKTSAQLVNAATELIIDLHSYETPCIITTHADQVNDDFLNWVNQQTSGALKKSAP